MNLKFLKIQATGNDFIVTDFNYLSPSFLSKTEIIKICNRNFGIGGDGFIALEKKDSSVFRFHYYNSDGSRGEMCANGCRAAIRYAEIHNWVNKGVAFNFEADDGQHSAIIKDDNIRVSLHQAGQVKPVDIKKYDLPEWINSGYSVNTGVPHLVLICAAGLSSREIDETGEKLRFHTDFQPAGTNVNFMECINDDTIFVRTFERGVDAETLSCGTGVTASALVFSKIKNKNNSFVNVNTAGGKLLVSNKSGEIFLEGPSSVSFEGSIKL